MERLDDELLVEILHRLPCSKSATRCKCVCKRWYGLINPKSDSDLYFINRFTRRKIDQNLREPFCIIKTSFLTNEIVPREIIVPFIENRAFFRSLNNGDGDGGGFSLNFLPCEEPDRICILAASSFTGLFVCCPGVFDHSVYFLCNPLTKQWLSLPPPPLASRRARTFTDTHKGASRVGFTHQEPDDDGDGNFKFNFVHRFRLVCVPVTSDEVGEDGNVSKYEIEIFSSETWEWTSYVVQRPPHPCSFVQPNNFKVITYNGIACWCDRRFIAFNPWDSTCHYIPVPESTGVICWSGPCRGRGYLQATSIHPACNNKGTCLTIWDLKDYKNGEWFVAHKIDFDDLTSPPKDSWLMKYAKSRESGQTIVLGVHPNDGDIVFLRCQYRVVMCDMPRRVWKVVGKLPEYKMGLYTLFPLVLPWWPTPVPMLPKIEREKLPDIPW